MSPANTKTLIIQLRLPSETSPPDCQSKPTGKRLRFVRATDGNGSWVTMNYQVPASTNCPRNNCKNMGCSSSDNDSLRWVGQSNSHTLSLVLSILDQKRWFH